MIKVWEVDYRLKAFGIEPKFPLNPLLIKSHHLGMILNEKKYRIDRDLGETEWN